MVVYLVPAAGNRHELYFEAPEEIGRQTEAPDGFLRRLAFTATEQWHALVESARGDVGDGRLARWRNAAVCAVAESIAEQRTLWALKGKTSAAAHFPSSLTAAEARQTLMALFTHARRHHLRWLVGDLLLLTISGILALVPGPNVIAYYFLFRVFGHLQSWRGARQGMDSMVWTFAPDASLTELGSLVDVPREARAPRVAAIAERLNLPHLSVFFDRVAMPST
jgi:Mitochondrial K+-H+ exchange-related